MATVASFPMCIDFLPDGRLPDRAAGKCEARGGP